MQGGKIEKERRERSIILDKLALYFSELSNPLTQLEVVESYNF